MTCLGPEVLCRYLEDRLEVEARHRAEEHLSRCGACRRCLAVAHWSQQEAGDFTAVHVPEELREQAHAIGRRAAVAEAPGLRRWWLLAAAFVLAASGLSFLDLGPDGPGSPDPGGSPGPGGDVLRSGGGGDRGEILAPADGAVLTAGALEFRWAPPAQISDRAGSTTFILLDGLGNILLRTSPGAGHLTLEPRGLDPPMTPGGIYFWYLVFALDDGTSSESEPLRFRWSPPEVSPVLE